MTLLFFLAFGVMALGMRLVALVLPARGTHTAWSFAASPLPSPTSPLRRRQPGDVSELLRASCLYVALAAAGYWTYWRVVVWLLPQQEWVLGYLGVPILLLVAEAVNVLTPLVWLSSGWRLPPLVNHPLLARGPTDFWSRRWNLWFSDWFRYAIFSRMRRRPVLALFAVFFVSGVMHEWVINLPLYYLTGKIRFGSMMIYFLLQPFAILIERRFLARAPWARVALVWLVVVGPVPLLLNEGLLRTLQLWPGD